MFSRRFARLHKQLTISKGVASLLVFFTLLGLTGCGNFFGDGKRENPQLKIQSSLNCFDQAGATISDYVSGKVPIAQMDSLLECTLKSVDEFTNKVTGAAGKANTYDQNDISVFLDQYLLRSGKFDHQLLSMLFDLKASSIGGEARSISPKDIEKLKSLLVNVKTSLHEVNPYLGLLTRRETIDPHRAADQERFEEAIMAFRSAMSRLAPYFAPTNFRQRLFTMDEGFDLLASLGLDMKKYQPYKELSRLGKQLLVGGAPDTIRAEEWRPLIRRAIDTYVIFLRYHAFIQPLPLTDSVVTPQLHTLANDSFALISDSVVRQNQQVLGEAQIQNLVRALSTAGLLPISVTPQAINAFLPIVVEKWLADRTSPATPSSHGIGRGELNVLFYYVQNWLDGMDLLQKVSPSDVIDQDLLRAALQTEAAQPAVASERVGVATRKRAVLNQWNLIFGQGRQWAWNANHFLILASKRSLPDLRREDLFRMNIERTAVEAVLRTYAKDPQRSQALAGLTSPEVQDVYLDIRDISNQLHFIDPRVADAGTRTFMETNLFTSAANGDNLMQFREAIDWLGSAVSSTVQGTAIFRDIGKSCAPSTQRDLLGGAQLDEACFRAGLRKGFASYFGNFPNLVAFFKQSLGDDASWNAFISAFEIIARPQGAAPGPIDLGSVRSVVTVMGYNESLFLRTDTDENQILSDNELWAMFPLVQPLIQSAMASVAPPPFVSGACTPPVTPPLPPPPAAWLQKAVFSYLIQNGHPPPASGLASLGVPFAFARSYIPGVKLTRLDLIKTIASFTTLNNQKRNDAIAAFYLSQQASLRTALESGVCSVTQRILTLFSCDPTAQTELVRMVREKESSIFSAGSAQTPDQFRQALEMQLQNDPALRAVCSPF